MVTLDTSALLALFDSKEPNHHQVLTALSSQSRPWVVPAQIMAEIAWMVVHRLHTGVFLSFLDDIVTGAYLLDCGEQDSARIRELIARYDDMPLGFADAAVVACAERHGGNVLTLDHRHLGVVAKGTSITIFP